MKEEEELLEDLFEPKFPTEDLIKEAARRSYMRQFGISVVAIGLLSVLVWGAYIQIMPVLEQKEIFNILLYQDIVGANRFETSFGRTLSLFGSRAKATQYKIVGDKPIIVGELSLIGGDNDHVIPMKDGSVYSETGHKMMTFYHPGITYSDYKNDWDLIKSLSEASWIEVGISFDQAMSREEVEKLLPEGVMLNWCWVDSLTLEQLPNDYIIGERDAVGYSMLKEDGEPIEDPEGVYRRRFEIVSERKGPHREFLREQYTALKNMPFYKEGKGLPVIGAVVVGKKEALLELQEVSQIKASVVGEVTDY